MTENLFEPVHLDVIDIQIIDLLSHFGKMGNKEIAARIGLTVSPTFERIKRLERTGVIKGYKAIIDKKQIGKGLQAFCYVSLKAHNAELIREFEDKVVHLDQVTDCYHIAGNYDYSMLIEVRNIEEYQRFLKEELAEIPNIANVQSSFVLGKVVK